MYDPLPALPAKTQRDNHYYKSGEPTFSEMHMAFHHLQITETEYRDLLRWTGWELSPCRHPSYSNSALDQA